MADRVAKEALDDDDDNVYEINSLGTISFKAADSGSSDPFEIPAEEAKNLSGTGAVLKRRVSNELKKFNRSADGKTSSNRIEEEAYTGYDVFGVVTPPYNLDYLAKLYEISSPHYSAVNAKVANIVGLGFKLVETGKTKREFEDISEEAKRKKFRVKLARHHEELLELMENFNHAASISVMDIKTTRRGMVEEYPWGVYVWQTPDGEILGDGDGNLMNVFCMKGDQSAISALKEAANCCGLSDDPSFVESLTISGYRNGEMDNQIARTITLSAPAHPMDNTPPSEFDLSSGINFEQGSASVGPSVSTPATNYNAIELIMRVNEPNEDIRMFDARADGNTEYWGFDLSTNTTHLAGLNVYFNGTLASPSAVPVVGRWYIVHLVSTAGGFDSFVLNRVHTGGSVFSGDVTLSRVRLYPSALSQSEITKIVDNYRGTSNIQSVETNVVSVTEPVSSTDIYTYDWSISAAG